jgi:UDP-glucose 4-epimerase
MVASPSAAEPINRVLLTGGAGFIGSHCAVELIEAGYQVLLLDDFSNSSPDVVERVAQITGTKPMVVHGDCRDRSTLDSLFTTYTIDAVVHLAGRKFVAESVENPFDYYDVNLGAASALLQAMRRHRVGRLVFSSSCSIHGSVETSPIAETAGAHPTNPYSRTKWFIEQMLTDACRAEPSWSVISLRYFNPAGAHRSGKIGEDPAGRQANLMPLVMQTAAGWRDEVVVFGDDYQTPDGSGRRDYLHVLDLAAGHRQAIDHLTIGSGHRVYNMGTGTGVTVLELIETARKVTGRPIPHRIAARRPGDVDSLVADSSLAAKELGWTPTRSLAEMCEDAWRWQCASPASPGLAS